MGCGSSNPDDGTASPNGSGSGAGLPAQENAALDDPRAAMTETLRKHMNALADGDGKTACETLAGSARDQLSNLMTLQNLQIMATIYGESEFRSCEDAVTRVGNFVAMVESGDSQKLCELPEFRRRSEQAGGDVESCVERMQTEILPTLASYYSDMRSVGNSARVTDVKIDGDTATSKIVTDEPGFGEDDQNWALEDGKWKMARTD